MTGSYKDCVLRHMGKSPFAPHYADAIRGLMNEATIAPCDLDDALWAMRSALYEADQNGMSGLTCDAEETVGAMVARANTGDHRFPEIRLYRFVGSVK